jgi:hypothetical protein
LEPTDEHVEMLVDTLAVLWQHNNHWVEDIHYSWIDGKVDKYQIFDK